MNDVRFSSTGLLLLRGFSVLVLVTMIVATSIASLEQPIWNAGSFLEEPWGIAALMDAYYGFLFFYLWVWYKSPQLPARVGWFVGIMLLGNMAMGLYFLLQTLTVKANDPVEHLLLRRGDS